MEEVKTIFDNPALIGLIGVAIGSLISFLGGFLQSLYNNKHNEKMIVMQKNQELKYEKKAVYVEFISLFTKYKMNEFFRVNYSNFDVATVDDSMGLKTSEGILILARLNLLAPQNIRSICVKISNSGTTDDNSKLLEELILLMKKDLGIEE